MTKKLSPDEEAWGTDLSLFRPAFINFVDGLQLATKGYESGKLNSECAAVAVAATIAYVRDLKVGDELLAPLKVALDIIEASVDPVSLPSCRRAQAAVSNMDAYKDGSLPSVDEFVNLRRLSKATTDKIIGSIAVEYQLLNKASLEQALKNVAGQDSRARKRLKDFRNNMRVKDSPKGAQGEFFRLMQLAAGLPPVFAAQFFLNSYRNAIGKKS